MKGKTHLDKTCIMVRIHPKCWLIRGVLRKHEKCATCVRVKGAQAEGRKVPVEVI